ncbi:uncharacterized [Tachysurus ichikawai]
MAAAEIRTAIERPSEYFWPHLKAVDHREGHDKERGKIKLSYQGLYEAAKWLTPDNDDGTSKHHQQKQGDRPGTGPASFPQ